MPETKQMPQPPQWYTVPEMLDYLIREGVPTVMAHLIVMQYADNLQQAFKKGWEKGYNDYSVRPDTWNYVYYRPDNAARPRRWEIWTTGSAGPIKLGAFDALTFDDAVARFLDTLHDAERDTHYNTIKHTTPGKELTHHFYRQRMLCESKEAAESVQYNY